ncbi:ABC transporter permease [bacterium]|nr:ABC transporter permease [bacterium]
MKSIDIALKDISHAFRSMFALAFMFGVPILMTLLFGFLFGGVGGGDAEFSVPVTDVVFVNQDQGSDVAPSFESDAGTFESMGAMLVDLMQGDNFSELMNTSIGTEAEARAAVDAREAGMAVIIPPGFTETLIGMSDDQVAIEFHKDPELSLGPQVSEAVVMSVVDGFSSGTLSLETINRVLADNGVTLSQQEQMALVQTLTQNAEQNDSGLTIIRPADAGQAESGSLLQTILRSIMGGMMIFYAFYTGTSAAQTIVEEEEAGTLARLFISPTSVSTILNGKFLAGFMMVIVQVTVLLLFGNLAFGINWGPLPSLMVFSVGLVAVANSFGIFIMSLVKSTRQAGIIYGAVLTFSGMLGISSIFTVGTSAEAAFEVIPLVVPQGWAMRALETAWSGDFLNTLMLSGAMLVWAVLFFVIGATRFKRRFA